MLKEKEGKSERLQVEDNNLCLKDPGDVAGQFPRTASSEIAKNMIFIIKKCFLEILNILVLHLLNIKFVLCTVIIPEINIVFIIFD